MNRKISGNTVTQGYKERLARLVGEQWKGEDWGSFGKRINLGQKTVQAWVEKKYDTEPRPPSLRKFAQYLDWEYWELLRYLDTGEKPQTDEIERGNNVSLAIEQAMRKTLDSYISQHGSFLLMSRLTEMIAECIRGKSDEKLQAQIAKYREADAELAISWETFLLIKEGRRRVYDEYEATTLAGIVDPEERFTIDQWLEAASISDVDPPHNQEENNNSHTNNNHVF